MAGEFVDLMAFARGAEMANKANWQDTLNDINARSGEEKLRQQQTTYDLNLPVAQLKSEQAYGAELGNRAQAEFQTGALTEMSKLPAEQQAGFLADSISKRLQNIQAMGPGAGNELQGLQNFVARQAQDYIKAGDVTSAQRLYAALPGAGQAQANRAGDLLKWSDPKTALDPLNLATEAANLGWKYDPKTDMVVQPNGTSMRGYEFANMKRTQANYVLSDMTPGLQRVQERTMAQQGAEELAKQYQAAGYMTWINPITNQVIPLDHSGKPVAQGTGPAAAAAPNPTAPTVANAAPMPAAAPAAAPMVTAAPAQSFEQAPYQEFGAPMANSFDQSPAQQGAFMDWVRNMFANSQQVGPSQRYVPTGIGPRLGMTPNPILDNPQFFNQTGPFVQPPFVGSSAMPVPPAVPQYPLLTMPPQGVPQMYNATPPGWMTQGR